MLDRRIGAQLFTLRDFCKTAEDFDATCRKVREIGYQTVQLSGIGPIGAEEIKKSLDTYGLKAVVTHRSPDEYEHHLEDLIKFHKTIGCGIAGLGMMPGLRGAEEDTVNAFIDKYNRIAAELGKNGLTFAYHNHALEFAKCKGKYVFDILAENTDPEYFKFTVDVYWIAFAGVDPAKYIQKLKNRIACVHFKDLGVASGVDTSTNSIVMRPVTEGNLVWDEIIAACDEAGAQWAQVEQDDCYGEDPFDCMRRSYENLKTKGFC